MRALAQSTANGCSELIMIGGLACINASIPKNRLAVIYLGLKATMMTVANALPSETQQRLRNGKGLT